MKAAAVHQFASQISEHDAVGNEVFALQSLLKSFGFASDILCEFADPELLSLVRLSSPARLRGAPLLMHFSHGFATQRDVFTSSSGGHPRILVYHNITPPEYFAGTHDDLAAASRHGRDALREYSDRFALALAHSSFSAAELGELGYQRVTVFPYVLYESLYRVPADEALLSQCREPGWTNILAVGKIAPHKCLEDTLFVFDYFKRVIKKQSRLYIVGSWQGMEAYFGRLSRLVAKLGLTGVIFTGPVSQSQLAAYYKAAHAFVCMSEHEGFCVPAVEAMYYGVPVLAYHAAAVPETIGDAGVLFREKNWPVFAESIAVLLDDPPQREEMILAGRARAESFGPAAARLRLEHVLREAGILEEGG